MTYSLSNQLAQRPVSPTPPEDLPQLSSIPTERTCSLELNPEQLAYVYRLMQVHNTITLPNTKEKIDKKITEAKKNKEINKSYLDLKKINKRRLETSPTKNDPASKKLKESIDQEIELTETKLQKYEDQLEEEQERLGEVNEDIRLANEVLSKINAFHS